MNWCSETCYVLEERINTINTLSMLFLGTVTVCLLEEKKQKTKTKKTPPKQKTTQFKIIQIRQIFYKVIIKSCFFCQRSQKWIKKERVNFVRQPTKINKILFKIHIESSYPSIRCHWKSYSAELWWLICQLAQMTPKRQNYW